MSGVFVSDAMYAVNRARGLMHLPEIDVDLSAVPVDDVTDMFIDVSNELDKAKAVVDAFQAAKDALEQQVVKNFGEAGRQSEVRKGKNVHLRREFWPSVDADDLSQGLSPDDKIGRDIAYRAAVDRLVEALGRDPQTAYLVKPGFNHTTLRSFMLENFPKDDLDAPQVPPELVGKMKVIEKTRAIVKKA